MFLFLLKEKGDHRITLYKFSWVFCSALLLNSVMSAFKPEFIAKRALELVEIMKECDDSGFPKVINVLLIQLFF